jgi:hypothetical protein
MKKLLIFSIMCLSIVGCGPKENHEVLLSEYAKMYYDKLVKNHVTVQVDNYEVTIAMMINAKNKTDIDYDLDILNNCADDSKVLISFDKSGEIIGYIYEIECN